MMIMRGNTSRALTWPGLLAVFALGALLLPARMQAQPPAPKDKAGDRRVEVGGPELSKAADDLAKAEVELKKKMQEIEAMRARIAALKKMQDARSRLEGLLKVAPRMPGTGGVTIRIEISGLNLKPEEIKDLAKKLEAAVPGGKRQVIILGKDSRPGDGVRFWLVPDGASKKVKIKSPPKTKVVPGAPPGKGPGAAAPDKRVEKIEQALEKVLREVEALRREVRDLRSAPRPGEGKRSP
jgi:hypothetical protein